MKEYQSLSHTRWDCKCHVVFIPKRRKKRVFGALRRHLGQKNFTGEHFWARSYFVSTVGLDEHIVRAYIRNQENEDDRYDQMKLAMG